MSAVIVKSANSTLRTVPRKDGTKMQFIEQQCAIDSGDEFPQPFRINLDEGQKPYSPGRYYVSPTSFSVNKYGGLEFARRVTLLPLPDAK